MKVKKNILLRFHIIYLGIFIIPFQYLISTTVFTIALLGISVFSLVTLIKKRITIPFTFFNLSYLFLLLFGLISTFFSRDTTSTYSILIQIIPYFFYCIILSWYILDGGERAYERIVISLKTFLLSTLILCIFVVINDLQGFNVYTRIGYKTFGNQYTMFTYYLMISVSIAIWLYFKQVKMFNKRTLEMILIVLFVISVFTAIRKAIIIPIVYWGMYVYMTSVNKKKLISGFMKVMIGIALLVVSYFFLMNFEYFAFTVGRRMQGFIAGLQGNNSVADNSFNVREQLAIAAIECFKTYPFFGYGFGAFRDYAHETIGVRLYAHNNYLELLASTGVTGFIIYYGFLTLLLRKLYVRFKVYKNAIFIFGIAFIISLLVNELAAVTYLSLPYMVMLTLISCLSSYKINPK
jgi:O-antigen ligase